MKKLLSSIMMLTIFVLVSPIVLKADTEFNDINLYKEQINYLNAADIIKGYDDGSFKPNEPLRRIQALQMILNEMDVTLGDSPDPGFKDITQDSYGYDYIAKAKELNIIRGNNGYFDSWGTLTRVQMASILANAYGLEIKGESSFKDIPQDFYAKEAIDAMASNDISSGYSDGTFKPYNKLTRQHFALFLSKVLDDKFKPASITEKELINIIDTAEEQVTQILFDEWEKAQPNFSENATPFGNIEGEISNYYSTNYTHSIWKDFYYNGLVDWNYELSQAFPFKSMQDFKVKNSMQDKIIINFMEPESGVNSYDTEYEYTLIKENGNWVIDKTEEIETNKKIIYEKTSEFLEKGDYHEYGDQLEVVNFLGTKVPQILTINEEASKSVIRVHQYTEKDKKWKVIYQDKSHDSFGGFERLLILDTAFLTKNNKKQQAIIGNHSGSGGYLSFFILGEHKGRVKPVVDRTAGDIYQGNVKVKNKAVHVYSNGRKIETIRLN